MSKKVPVITTPNYVVYFEHFAGKIWLHVDVHKWTARIKEEFIEQFNFVMDSYKTDLYAVNEPEGHAKRRRFMVMIGMEFAGRRNFGNGILYDMYRRPYHG